LATGEAENDAEFITRHGPAHDIPRAVAGPSRNPAVGAERLQSLLRSVSVAAARIYSAKQNAQKKATHLYPS
jgi:hypothetical protein